ncbi:MAG: serine hydrolase domain-containing protein [Thermomicrobiales bacterium]
MPTPTSPASPSRVTRRHIAQAAALAGGAAIVAGSSSTLARTQAGTPDASRDASPEASDDASTFTAEEQLRFLGIVERGLAIAQSPSALVGVWSGERVWKHAVGTGNLRTGVPASTDDHWRIASNTKTFVATVVLQLVDEGVLSLDDTLEPLIAGVANGDRITIRQLLGMTAGIYDYVRAPAIAEDYPIDPNLAFLPEDALAIIRAGKPDFAPGEGLAYCNSNYVLLGYVVELVTGNPIEDEIQARLLDPLGLTQTSFARTSAMPEPFVHGYNDRTAGGGELIDASISNPDVGWAAGAMISTLDDLHTWVTAMTDGSLLSAAAQAERLQFVTIAEQPVAMGYGLGILRIGPMQGHNGGIVGYSSWMVRDPETDTTIVLVSMRGGEKGGTGDPIFYDLAHEFFPDRILSFDQLAAAHTAASSGTPVASPTP